LLSTLINKIFKISNDHDFNDVALKVFKYQYDNIPIYQDYVKLKNVSKNDVTHFSEIPFLPIQFFKTHPVVNDVNKIEKIFLSSGTTKSSRSKHYIKNLEIYKQSFLNGFKNNYGNPNEWIILALLPSYLEQGDSSLIFMVDQLIKMSQNENSRYIDLKNDNIESSLNKLKSEKVLLIGVSYALLDLAEIIPSSLSRWTIMETGGMKGRRKEIIRDELHLILKKAFDVDCIHSEYGMSELLSQAYSLKDGLFSTPKWMKVIIRDLEDPFNKIEDSSSGGINIIDLANIFSCSFIETQDIGKKNANEKFEVLGRSDHSEIRGCNLLTL
jgi:phenylacetate-coenzyme A ligase PaaK-like adenylate-forming protein